MRLAVFWVFLVLYFYESERVLGQPADSPLVIEYGPTDFLIERSFTLSLLVRDSENRPTISFPDVPGLVKQGIAVSTTRSELAGREVVNQVITQTYLASRPGTIRIAPFTLSANGQSVRSPGVVLTVRHVSLPPVAAVVTPAKARNDKQAAFLQTSVSQTDVYTGEELQVRLSFFVADTYPFEVKFEQLAQQVATIVRTLRPANAWEENNNISELAPRPATINGRNYIEYRLYQATFFLLPTRTGTNRTISLPAVPLTVTRQLTNVLAATLPTSSSSPVAPSISAPLQAETVTFTSQPVTIRVRPLPRSAGQSGTSAATTATGQIAVGTFRLVDEIDRSRVAVGQSVRYDIRIEGRGNIAGIQPPQATLSGPDLDVFPPQIEAQISRTDEQVSGVKSFRYFLVPKQKGTLTLANRFFWVYFDPRSGRYDTLRPQAVLRVGGASDSPAVGIVPPDTLDGTGRPSVYAGLEQIDSTETSVNWPVLVRATANVLIILMILGTLFVFVRK